MQAWNGLLLRYGENSMVTTNNTSLPDASDSALRFVRRGKRGR